MIAKIKNIWYDLIHKGEKNMPTTTSESTSTRKLKEQVKSQAGDISALRTRISQLVDEIRLLQTDIGRFKERVADDVKMIVEKMNK
jgi:predicted RNase H-like nuclease (RuvC/YqgF family)